MTLSWPRIPHMLILRTLVTVTFVGVAYLVAFTWAIQQPRHDGPYRTCADFPTWAAAQAALRQYPRLDADRDGWACEHLGR